ncbi:hypothetical protein F01_480277 [Burkholderia cenocepacia]|nr:hypothetical protein F01_480277 [Burkholderia cenocepacia]
MRHGREGAGRPRELLRSLDRRAGERHARAALAGLRAPAVRLCARLRPGRAASGLPRCRAGRRRPAARHVAATRQSVCEAREDHRRNAHRVQRDRRCERACAVRVRQRCVRRPQRTGDALFWQPRTAGSYTVRVVDDHGRSDQRPPGVGLKQ